MTGSDAEYESGLSHAEESPKRRRAVEQLGGPRETQMFLDADFGRPVVLEQKDGWGLSKRDYMKRTWSVMHPRDYVADSGHEIKTISQRTKLDRLEDNTYRLLTDESVKAIIDRATEKNREWMAVNRPHIPYDGEGGVNVYVEAERLSTRRVIAEDQIAASDDSFEPTVEVELVYGGDEKRLTVTTGGETIPYERESPPDSLEDGVPFVPEDDRDGPLVELRLDTECEDHGETEYEYEVVDDV